MKETRVVGYKDVLVLFIYVKAVLEKITELSELMLQVIIRQNSDHIWQGSIKKKLSRNI